jgi:multiple sugar transport system substrate-binding protein
LLREAGIAFPPEDASKPWTWAQFVEAAKKLTRDSSGKTPNDPGFNYDNVVQYGTLMPTWWLSWLPLLYTTDSGIANDTGTALKMNSPDGTRVIQSIANLSLVDKVAPSFAMASSSAFSSSPTLLMNKQVAMYIAGTFVFPDFSNEGYDVGVAQIPTFSPTGKGNNISWGAPFVLSKGASKEAQELYLYMANYENTVKAAAKNNIAVDQYSMNTATVNDPVLNAEFTRVFNPVMGKVEGDIIINASRMSEHIALKNSSEIIEQIIVPELDKVWMGEETAAQAMQNLDRQLAGKFQGMYR